MMGVMDMGAFASGAEIRRLSSAWAEETAATVPPPPPAAPDRPAWQVSSYTPGRPRWTVILVVFAIHLAAIAALVTMRFEGAAREEALRIATFSIEASPPPPPPAPPEPAVQAPAAPVVAPVSPIELPTRSDIPAVAVAAPEPTIAPVQLVVENVAPVPKPTRPATPAPIVPPDFSASQLRNPGPEFPYLSRKAREEGVVVLRVLVSADGRAARLEVEESSGFERLDAAALKTVKKWRFIPASQEGKPREAWVLVPITFSLN